MKTIIGMLGILILFCGCIDTAPKVTIQSELEKWINTTEGNLVFMATGNSGGTIECKIELK